MFPGESRGPGPHSVATAAFGQCGVAWAPAFAGELRTNTTGT